MTGSVHARVGELLAHYETRLSQALAAVGRCPSHAYDVATRLTWTLRHRPFDTLDAFNQMLAVTETAAHLGLLVARGRLVATDEHGTVVYGAAPG